MPLARTLLLLLSPALMATGCSDRHESLASPPDAPDLGDASAAPDVTIPGDAAATACAVHPGSGYSALDTGLASRPSICKDRCSSGSRSAILVGEPSCCWAM